MVEVRLSRAAVEALAEEGVRIGVVRTDTQVAGLFDDDTGEARLSRLSIEVLGTEALQVSVTRVETQVAGLLDEDTGEVGLSRASVEVLASEILNVGVTRVETQVAGLFDDATAEVRTSRVAVEVLGREGTTSALVVPLALADDAHFFLHNWATKAELTSSWKTSVVHSAATGAESRRGLTFKPQRSMKLEWQLCDSIDLDTLERLEVVLRRMTNDRFQVPLYMDQQELSAAFAFNVSTIDVSTRYGRFFPGARVAIYRPATQEVTWHLISTMTNDSLTFTDILGTAVSAGDLVFPVIDCEVALEVDADYLTARVPRVTLTVVEAPGASRLPALRADNPPGANSFDSRPVWFEEPDWSGSVVKGRRRHGSSSSEGRSEFISLEANRSRQIHKYDINGEREPMWRVIEFFETRRGRLRAFWHVDQDQYLEPLSIDAAGNFVNLRQIGTLADLTEEFDYIGLVMSDGNVYVREATNLQDVVTAYRVTASPVLPAGLDAADVHRVARARLSRFDSDEITEVWTTTGYMACKVDIIEVLNEADYEI